VTSHKSVSDGIRISVKAVHKSVIVTSTNAHHTAQTHSIPHNEETKPKSVKSVSYTRLDMHNNAVFEGEVDNEGKPFGRGKLTLANGDFYEGEFVDGCFEGFGVLNKKSEGALYRGQFKKNMRYGKACSSGRTAGSTKEVSAKTSEKATVRSADPGTYCFEDGSTYLGNHKNNEFDGFGIFSWKNGQVYEGRWKAGLMEGDGKLIYDNGNSFDGEFKNNKRHGTGLFIWAATGASYKGGWKDGVMHGKGITANQNGEVKYVDFLNGNLKDV